MTGLGCDLGLDPGLIAYMIRVAAQEKKEKKGGGDVLDRRRRGWKRLRLDVGGANARKALRSFTF